MCLCGCPCRGQRLIHWAGLTQSLRLKRRKLSGRCALLELGQHPLPAAPVLLALRPPMVAACRWRWWAFSVCLSPVLEQISCAALCVSSGFCFSEEPWRAQLSSCLPPLRPRPSRMPHQRRLWGRSAAASPKAPSFLERACALSWMVRERQMRPSA